MKPHPLRTHIEEVVALTDEEFAHVINHFKALNKRKHQYIIQEDEFVNYEYWIIKGCVKSYYLDENGKEHILQFGLENWWITDYEAFVKKTKSKIAIECIEDTQLLRIPFEDRNGLAEEMSKMEKFWARKTKFGYIALQNRILSLLTNTPSERYRLFLKKYPQLLQRIPKKYIAAYLGVSRETLSRLQS